MPDPPATITRIPVRLLPLLILLLSALGATAPAQEPAPSPSAAPSAVPSPAPSGEEGEVTVEAITKRLAETEQNAELAPEVKAKILEAYQQALEQAKLAEGWTAKGAEFDALRISAPERLATIKENLKKMSAAEAAPTPDPSLGLAELEVELTKADTGLKAAQQALAAVESDQNLRIARRADIPKLLISVRERLAGVVQQRESFQAGEDPPALVRARRARIQARIVEASREIESHEKELLSYDARSELLTARRDLASREVAALQKTTAALRELLNEKRRTEAEDDARKARQELLKVRPELVSIAQENSALAEQRTGAQGLTARIEATTKQVEDVREQAESVTAEFASVRGKVETAGSSRIIGYLLRNRRAELPDLTEHKRRARQRRQEISRIQLEHIQVSEMRDDLVDNIDLRVEEVMRATDPSLQSWEKAYLESQARRMYEARLELLRALLRDYDTYLSSLLDLEVYEDRLAGEVGRYAAFIDERVLWIRSSPFLGPRAIPEAGEALGWIFDPANATGLARSLGRLLAQDGLNLALLALLTLAYTFVRRSLMQRLKVHCDAASKRISTDFKSTAAALLITLVLTFYLPFIIQRTGYMLSDPAEENEFVRAFGASLVPLALFLYLIGFLRWLSHGRGLGLKHFGWHERSVRSLRMNALAFTLPGALCIVLAGTIEAQTINESWKDSLGRMTSISGFVVLGVLAQRLLSPTRGIPAPKIERDSETFFARTRWIWHFHLVSIPFALAVISVIGFHYTSIQLARRLYWTVWILVGAVVVQSMVRRWMLMERRRLAIEQWRKRREAAQAEAAAGSGPEGVVTGSIPQPEIDLTSVSEQAIRLLRGGVLLACIAGLWLAWVDIFPALRILDRVELWQTTVSVTEEVTTTEGVIAQQTVERVQPVTLASLALALLIMGVAAAAAANLPGLLEFTILQRFSHDFGFRFAFKTITRYLITMAGGLAAFQVIGLSWNSVQWLAAAMTVGLGFGLQEIFANFVSGIILLFERPIRIGDIVTVAETSGRVTRLGMRATTITDWDRRELIVPNKDFITSRLINWTLTDPITRVSLDVGIAYGSDTKLAREIMLKVLQDEPLIMDDPEPNVVFIAFGESTLNFKLYYHLAVRDVYLIVIQNVHAAIDEAFRKAGIEIAFPQRDVHLDLTKGPLDVRMVPPDHPPAPAPSAPQSAPERPDPARG